MYMEPAMSSAALFLVLLLLVCAATIVNLRDRDAAMPTMSGPGHRHRAVRKMRRGRRALRRV